MKNDKSSSIICISIVTHQRQLSSIIIRQYLFNTFFRDLKSTTSSIAYHLRQWSVSQFSASLRLLNLFLCQLKIHFRCRRIEEEKIIKLEIISGTSWVTLLMKKRYMRDDYLRNWRVEVGHRLVQSRVFKYLSLYRAWFMIDSRDRFCWYRSWNETLSAFQSTPIEPTVERSTVIWSTPQALIENLK